MSNIAQPVLASLQNGKPRVPGFQKDGVLVAFPNSSMATASTKEISDLGLSLDMGSLPNPSEWVLIAYNGLHPTGRLNAKQTAELPKIVSRLRGRLEPDWTIPMKFGPDGKTPLVFADDQGFYAEKGLAKLVDVEDVLSFPTEKQAKEAEKYLAHPFKTTVTKDGARWLLHGAHKVSQYNETGNYETLEALAKSFGGKFEYTESEGQE